MKAVCAVVIIFILANTLGCNSGTGEIVTDSRSISKALVFPDTFHLGDRVVKVVVIDSIMFREIPEDPGDTSEAQNIAKDSLMVKRYGDSLVFRINGDKRVSLVNYDSDTDEGSYANYFFLGHDRDLGQYVVRGTFFEHQDNLLIDDITGDTTYVLGLPILNPDKKTFISCGHGVEGDGILCCFEFYKNSHKPELIGSKTIYDIWTPEAIKWKNANTLLAKGWTFDSTGKPNDVYYQFTIN